MEGSLRNAKCGRRKQDAEIHPSLSCGQFTQPSSIYIRQLMLKYCKTLLIVVY